MESHLLMTIDCDLRSSSVAGRQMSLDTLLDVFDDEGLAGHVTWYLNETDFHITENHESFLREVLRRGDTIGMHDHVDDVEDKTDEAALHDQFQRSLLAVQRWLGGNGFDEHIAYHRMGCLYQNEHCYRTVMNLGYTVVSEVYPGYKMPDIANNPSFDNRGIPVGAGPYRHDAENFLDYRSQQGQLLHFPVSFMFLRHLDFARVQRWLNPDGAGQEKGRYFMWLLHPYELCRIDDRDVIDPEQVGMLRQYIGHLTEEFSLVPANLEACAKLYGA